MCNAKKRCQVAPAARAPKKIPGKDSTKGKVKTNPTRSQERAETTGPVVALRVMLLIMFHYHKVYRSFVFCGLLVQSSQLSLVALVIGFTDFASFFIRLNLCSTPLLAEASSKTLLSNVYVDQMCQYQTNGLK
ncbi:hypothetical protein JZ751_011743 [Albula glossodonta]|uniref:Uncharacterized protein n=1 Tax=Albula glossodonta TaxID=121402 RepID=A0A8T2PQG8_9TELE|nr:hypothetical protein JZ751_011743 [Albula glossodonta]